jgi:hypothetical protein
MRELATVCAKALLVDFSKMQQIKKTGLENRFSVPHRIYTWVELFKKNMFM